jgi:hypothetical protein
MSTLYSFLPTKLPGVVLHNERFAQMKRVLLFGSALVAIALILVLTSGCSEKSTWPTPGVVLESIPTTLRPKLDGKANDREWYSAPELLIAMGGEYGNGGGSFYVRMKSVYTPYPDTVYFMLQWADTTEDFVAERLIYVGQPWDGRDCSTDGGLVAPESWAQRPLQRDKEDRLALMFEITPAGDATGTFASKGCQVACHGNMHPISGKLDVWYWLDARTNQVSHCDDMYADSSGLYGDTGDGMWKINWREPTFVPRYIKEGDNGGLSTSKCVLDPGPFGRGFNQCDVRNPIWGTTWGDTSNPEGFDYVPGYLVKLPTGSRADVFARGAWDDKTQRWTIEIKRAMRTGAGHEGEDVFFYPNRTYNFTVAIMNGSRVIHSGSAPLVLRFRQ